MPSGAIFDCIDLIESADLYCVAVQRAEDEIGVVRGRAAHSSRQSSTAHSYRTRAKQLYIICNYRIQLPQQTWIENNINH